MKLTALFILLESKLFICPGVIVIAPLLDALIIAEALATRDKVEILWNNIVSVNKFVEAIKNLDIDVVKETIRRDPKWIKWSEPSGKNALHYLCAIGPAKDSAKSNLSLAILKLLLKSGMDINSIHEIPDERCAFPATPLWYAYTRGRNETLYKYMLKKGADPSNCMWAIAWYDDVAAAKLWLKHGAKIGEKPSLNDLFLGSFQWNKYKFLFWLLDQGADVNSADQDGNTALMLAVKRKDEDSIKLLVSHGADADKVNDKGISARTIAKTKGPKRLLNLL